MGFGMGGFSFPSASQSWLQKKQNEADREAQARANEANIASARAAEVWSSGEAQKQMDFQERMSSSAHQREVDDLKAAGLNPLLSVNSGASTPGGAMGSAFAAHSEPLPSALKGIADKMDFRIDPMLQLNRNAAKASIKNTEYDSFNKSLEGNKLRLENDLLDMRNDLFKKNPSLFKFREMAGSVSSAVAAAAAAAAAGKSLTGKKPPVGQFGQGLRR